MNGIYISGMEMPKEGSWKTIRIYPDGTCAVPNWQGDCTFIKDAKAIPAIDVQPIVRGKWISTGAGYLTSKCSACGHKSLEYGNYCPNCGADMRKPPEEVE